MILLVDNYYLLPYNSKFEDNITQLLISFTKQIEAGDTSEILNLVRSILLIDLSEYKLTRQHFESFLLTSEYEEYTSKWSYQKKEKYKKLFSTIDIIDSKKLHLHRGAIQRAKDFLPIKMQNVKIDPIKSASGDEPIAIYPYFASPILKLLVRKLNNIVGFKKTFFKWEESRLKYHTEIAEVSEYFKFIDKLFKEIKRYDDPGLPDFTEEFFDFFNVNSFEKNSFYIRYKDFINGQSSKIILVGIDEYISKRFILEAQKHLGEFYIYDCISGDFEIKPKQPGLIFRNVQKLSLKKLNDLSAELFHGKYKNKPVILQTNENLVALDYYNYEKVYLPEYNHIKPLLGRIFFFLAYEKKLLDTDLSNGNIIPWANSKTIISILSKIISLTELESILNEDIVRDRPLETLNLLAEDFWYDFNNFIEYKNKKLSLKPNELAFSNSLITAETQVPNATLEKVPPQNDPDKMRIVTITHNREAKSWIVEAPLLFQDPKPKPFPYSCSLAIRYIALLVKYTNHSNTIAPDELHKEAKIWQNESKKTEERSYHKKTKTDEGRLDENLRYFLKKCELTILKREKILMIDKVECFYNENGVGDPIKILINDPDMPEPEFIKKSRKATN